MAAHRKSHSQVSNLKKAVFGFAAASLIAVGGVSTVSAFSDSAKSNITVSSGRIDIQADSSKVVTWNIGSTLKPGDTATKSITIANKGTIPLNYTVKSLATPAPGTLATVLDATVTQGTTTGVKTKLSAINSSSRTLAAGATETVKIDVSWLSVPATDNNFQGATGDVTIEFAATS